MGTCLAVVAMLADFQLSHSTGTRARRMRARNLSTSNRVDGFEGWMEGAVHCVQEMPPQEARGEVSVEKTRGLRLLHCVAMQQRRRHDDRTSSGCAEMSGTSMCVDVSSSDDSTAHDLDNCLQSPKPFVLLEKAIRKAVEDNPPRGQRRPRKTCEGDGVHLFEMAQKRRRNEIACSRPRTAPPRTHLDSLAMAMHHITIFNSALPGYALDYDRNRPNWLAVDLKGLVMCPVA